MCIRDRQEEQALAQLRKAGHLAECGERGSAGGLAAGGHVGVLTIGGDGRGAYASILPPAPSIAVRAPLVTCTPLTVTARATAPDATMRARSVCSGTRFAAFIDLASLK